MTDDDDDDDDWSPRLECLSALEWMLLMGCPDDDDGR